MLLATMSLGTYSVVHQYDSEDNKKGLRAVPVQPAHQPWKAAAITLSLTLLASLPLNIYHIIQHSQISELLNDGPSKYGIRPRSAHSLVKC